ncbi:hypothetical protein HPB47_008967, partial [Ixodes persulcatus]
MSRPTFLFALTFWENLQEHPLIVRPNEDSPSHAGAQPMEAAVVGQVALPADPQRAASPTPTTMSQLFLTTSLTTQANTQSDILPSALGTGHPTYTTTDGGDPMDLQAPSGSGNTVKRTHQDPMFQKDIEKLEEPTKRVRAAPGNPSSPYPTPSPSQSYRVHIRPLARHDITSVPTKRIQQVIDRCLGTTGYKGYAAYKSTNSITVHLASLTDAQKMCTLTVIPLSEDQQLPRFFYYGRVLHPKPYFPRAIFCYRCYKQGHMQAFCPQRNIDPERTTPEGQPRYRCGLCKSDDHDMTAPNCPMKQKATARLPEAPHQPEDDIDAQIEALSRELERLRRHKELVTARRQKTGTTLPTSVNLGWIRHLRSTYPGVPILVGGDFNAPHSEWGYQYNTRRGDQVRNTMIDAAFTLLNQPGVSTCIASTTARTHVPDLTWWIGPGVPQWRAEPDTWGSDHMPIRSAFTVLASRKSGVGSATSPSRFDHHYDGYHNQTLPFYSYGQSAGRQTWLRLGTQLRRVVNLVSTILRLKRAGTKNSFPDSGGMSGVIILGPVLETKPYGARITPWSEEENSPTQPRVF